MRVQVGSALITAVVGVGMLSAPAAAQNVDWATCDYTTMSTACSSTKPGCCTESAATLGFGAATGDKALIIPMDRCHQQLSTPTTMGPVTSTSGPKWCADPSTASSNGMMFAYGLVYRLMQKGVPVYWLVN